MAETALIAGYYGRRNAGDEAILAGMLAELRSAREDLRFRVVSWDPEGTRRLHAVEAVPWGDVPGLIDAVSEASLVVVGGGGLFHDYWGVEPEAMLTSRQAGIAQYGAPIVLARLLGVPSMLYAVGVGPLTSEEGRRLTRELFDAADGATVRDAGSRALLAELGCSVESIEVVPDPAFHLPPGAPSPAADAVLHGLQRPILGVALRHWAFGADPADWQKQVAAALDRHLAERGGSALFVPLQDGEDEVEDDVRVCRAVMGRMIRAGQAALAPATLGPLERFALLGRCDAVLGMRMHAVIAALRAGRPVAALTYDPKVSAVMEAAGLGQAALATADWTTERIHRTLVRAASGNSAAQPGWSESSVATSAALAAALIQRGRRETVADEAALRRVAMAKLRAVQTLEALTDVLQDDLTQKSERLASQAEEIARLQMVAEQLEKESEALRLRSEKEIGAAREVAHRANVAREQAEAELARVRSSKGGRVLWWTWRVVWTARARLPITERASRWPRQAIRRLGHGWNELRRLRPLWLRRLMFASGPGAYVEEDNSSVILYSNRGDVFPTFGPRAELSAKTKSKVYVSLVVTVKNEEQNARDWLRGLAQQTRRPDEVVILDGGSSDNTLRILNGFASTSALKFRVVERPGQSIAARRNVGVLLADHDHIAMTDFGCTLDPDWLDRLLRPFDLDPEIDVVAGAYRCRPVDGVQPIAAAELVPELDEIDPKSFLPATRSIAFHRRAWEIVGGFPEWLTFAGEDTYFALELKRLGTRWAFVPEAQVEWHPPEGTLAVWKKLSVWAAGDGESGVRAASYVHGVRTLAALFMSTVLLAASGIAGALGSSSLAMAAFASACLAAILAGVPLLRPRAKQKRSLFWRALGLHARSVGYLRGVRNSPVVTARKHSAISGIRFVLSGVPIDDSGGGQRSAQLAKEWLRRGHLVVFLHAFPKNEAVDLQIPIRHPRLLHWSMTDFDWEGFRWEYGRLLKTKPALAIIEFPLPEFASLVRSMRKAGVTIVYDRIDAWETSLGAAWYSRRVENRVVESSHHLIATAPSLARSLEARYGRRVLCLPNAVDSRAFDPAVFHPSPVDLPHARPVFIYVGSLWGEWFDWDLLVQIADAFPEASVVVIGDYRGQCPRQPLNLHFLGLKPHSDLPAYLAHADVGIIPWKTGPITAATSPLKAYEYLAMGLPVVAPGLEALPDHPLVLRAHGRDEFITAMTRARSLRARPPSTAAFRAEHAWGRRVDALERMAGTPVVGSQSEADDSVCEGARLVVESEG